jgi:hypothetical protein|tara:strand:- start:1765 stop:1959 length:195 start_codon:yes stop_codon:yes gene_type:complete
MPKKFIIRELRNARRIISNPHLFSEQLIQLAWAVIRSANAKNIFLNAAPYRQGCAAYENADELA